MNYKFLLFLIFIISGCNQYSNNKSINLVTENKYKNSGFTLVINNIIKKENKIKKKIR